MSVDVFGRNLKKSEGGRGPPGIGFKITTDGHYDMENKRLCNLAPPNESHEAVNLGTLHNILEMEIDKVLKVTASTLTNNNNNLDAILELHKDEIDKKLLSFEKEFQIIKETVLTRSYNSHSLNIE